MTVIRSRQNAIGNNVLANDHGALVHPEFSDAAVHAIGRALHVPAQRGTLAGLGTVGMAGIATNQGVVVHPRTTESEAKVVEELLRVPVHRSTAELRGADRRRLPGRELPRHDRGSTDDSRGDRPPPGRTRRSSSNAGRRRAAAPRYVPRLRFTYRVAYPAIRFASFL